MEEVNEVLADAQHFCPDADLNRGGPAKPARYTPKPDQLALKFARKKAIAFMDSAGIPRLRLKNGAAGDMGWVIRSRQTDEWLAKIYFDKTGALIDPGAIRRVVLVLAGQAESQGGLSHDISRVVETDPFLGFLIQFVRHHRTISRPASKLLAEMRTNAANAPEHAFLNWPKSPEALGKRIRIYQDLLPQIGITVSFSRDKHQRKIILSDGDDRSGRQPSSQPSPVISPKTREALSDDGSDGLVPPNPRTEFDLIMKGLR